MNLAILKGRLTKDVTIRYTQSAEPKVFCTFCLAVNRVTKGECDFIYCKAWGKTACFIEKYFKKGQELLLQGRIEVNTLETNGERQTFFQVVADKVSFCGSKQSLSVVSSQQVEDFLDQESELPF